LRSVTTTSAQVVTNQSWRRETDEDPLRQTRLLCLPTHTWNSLPPAVRNIDSCPAFRRALKSHHCFIVLLPINFYFLYLRALLIDYCNAQSALRLGTRTLYYYYYHHH